MAGTCQGFELPGGAESTVVNISQPTMKLSLPRSMEHVHMDTFSPANTPNASSTSKYRLYVRASQPIVGCEIDPSVSIVTYSGINYSSSYNYRWLRSKKNDSFCAYSNCRKGNVFSDHLDSFSFNSATSRKEKIFDKVQAHGIGENKSGCVQCLECLKYMTKFFSTRASSADADYSEYPLNPTFCSSECFKRGYTTHAQYHKEVEELLDLRGVRAVDLAKEGKKKAPAASQNKQWPRSSSWCPDDPHTTHVDAPLSLSIGDSIPYENAETALRPLGPVNQGQVLGFNELARLSRLTERCQTQSSATEEEDNNAPIDTDADASWVVVSTEKKYIPTVFDVGHRLRLEVSARVTDIGTDGTTLTPHLPQNTNSEVHTLHQHFETPGVLPNPAMPRARRYLVSPNILLHPANMFFRLGSGRPIRVQGVRDVVGHTALRILCWNTLAEIYATPSAFRTTPMWQLQWNFRKHRILNIMLQYDPDIMALQELQQDAYEEYFNPRLMEMGYRSVFKAKTRTGSKVDGCAIFYKPSRLLLHSAFVMEYDEIATNYVNAGLKQLHQDRYNTTEYNHKKKFLDSVAKRLTRNNVAQFGFFAVTHAPDGTPLPKPQPLLVANTHLYWDPEFADVKLWQTDCLVRELEQAVTNPTKQLDSFSNASPLPVVLCGDFNSEPDSAVYKLITSREDEFAGISYPKDPLNILPLPEKIRHNLRLRSLYRACKNQEPEFTNYTADYVGTLDYVFASEDGVVPISVLLVPNKNEILQPLPYADSHDSKTAATASKPGSGPTNRFSRPSSLRTSSYDSRSRAVPALPNEFCPSDHVPLVFEICVQQSR